MPETNPLDFGTLHLSPLEAWRPADGQWWLSETTTYFNAWSASWHTRTLHRELHREHMPLSSDELRLLEDRGPTDHIFHFDLEGSRFDVAAARTVASATVLLRFSAIEIGQPSWDAIGESAHSALNADKFRSLFPRGQTLLYMRTPQSRVELRDEINGLHLGNPSVSVGWPVAVGSKSEQRLVLSVQVPIARGRSNTLESTGGWDAGVRWFAEGRWHATDLLAGAGYTHVDRQTTFFGFRRSDVWHAVGQANHPIGRHVAVSLGARFDTSVVAHDIAGEPGRPDMNLHAGVIALMGKNTSISFDLGENVPSVGLGADWSFHLQVTAALPLRGRSIAAGE